MLRTNQEAHDATHRQSALGARGTVFTANPVWKGRQKTRGNKASRSPGKAKGSNCQTSPMKKFFATSPKAYKHPDYPKWHEEFKRMNTGVR